MEALSRLHRRHRRRRRRRAAAAGLPRSTATPRSTSAIVEVAARLSRHGSGARRQRRLPADAARRLWLGGPRRDARVLRRAARQARRRRRCSSGWKRSARRALAVFDQPDAGMWELRGSLARAHVLERDVLGRLRPAGAHRGAPGHRRSRARMARRCRAHPPLHRRALLERERGSFVGTVGGDALDASLLLLADLGFLAPDDPRFAGTVRAIETRAEARRLHVPLRRAGRFRRARERVRGLHVLVRRTRWRRSAAATRRARCSSGCSRCRNAHGLLAEHLDPRTGEQWGNFVQTYSMVGAHHLGDPACRVPLGRGVLERSVDALGDARHVRRPMLAVASRHRRDERRGSCAPDTATCRRR